MSDVLKQMPKLCTRRAALGSFDRAARTVNATLATDSWIDGPFGPEKLLMSADAVQMRGADPTMPLHVTHGPDVPGTTGERIGIVENVRLDDDRLMGRLRLSKNDAGERALVDIEDRIITHVSIGYRVLDARPVERGILITKWTPLEVSLPSIVADRAAVIQRTEHMTDEHENRPVPDPTPSPVEETEAYRAGLRAAQEQTQAIETAFAPFPSAAALRTRALTEAWTLERARSELLSFLGTQTAPTPRGPDIVAGEDSMQKFVRAATDAICVRAGIILNPEEVKRPERIPVVIPDMAASHQIVRDNEYTGYSLRELAREYLRLAGDSVRGDAKTLVGRAIMRAGIISHSTSDFANLLVDAANKALQLGYEEAPETWEEWTGTMNASDFKTSHMPKLSTFSDLDEIPENGEFDYGTFSDFKETITVAAYGKLFSISRKAIINDDLSAFTAAPRGMARAANRKVGDLVYAIFSTNGNMSDGNALFSSGHSNYVAAGSGAAPSVTTLNAAYASMALQTDPGGATLNIVPTYILAGHTLRGTVDALLASALNPAEGGTTSFQQANIWRARLTPIYEARIDSDDTAKWYLAAARNLIDTVKVAFLNGVRTPRLEREEGFTVDGVILKVAHDVGVAPADWRGLYHNDGN